MIDSRRLGYKKMENFINMIIIYYIILKEYPTRYLVFKKKKKKFLIREKIRREKFLIKYIEYTIFIDAVCSHYTILVTIFKRTCNAKVKNTPLSLRSSIDRIFN